MTVDNAAVLALLFDYRKKREAFKAARISLSIKAVALGMDQKDSLEGNNAAAFLDGYLIAAGHVPSARKPGDTTDA